MRWEKAWHPRRIAADGKGGMKMRLNAFLDRREHFSRAIAVERVCRRQVVVQRGIKERKNNEDREKQREIKSVLNGVHVCAFLGQDACSSSSDGGSSSSSSRASSRSSLSGAFSASSISFEIATAWLARGK